MRLTRSHPSFFSDNCGEMYLLERSLTLAKRRLHISMRRSPHVRHQLSHGSSKSVEGKNWIEKAGNVLEIVSAKPGDLANIHAAVRGRRLSKTIGEKYGGFFWHNGVCDKGGSCCSDTGHVCEKSQNRRGGSCLRKIP